MLIYLKALVVNLLLLLRLAYDMLLGCVGIPAEQELNFSVAA